MASPNSIYDDEVTHQEAAGYVASPPMRDFGIDAYDEGFREAALLPESKRSLSEILSGFSYDSQVLQGFESLLGSEIDFDANAIVLLYNFDADVDRQSEIVSGVVQLRFMGAVDFTPSVV